MLTPANANTNKNDVPSSPRSGANSQQHMVPLLRHTTLYMNDLAATLRNDRMLLEHFRLQLESEFADENLEFFELASEYEEAPSLELANAIIDTYIAPNSVRQVSQPSECKSGIEKDAKVMNETRIANPNIFDDAMAWCMTMMLEAWPRFLKSGYYQDYLADLADDNPELLSQLDQPSDDLSPERKLQWLLRNPSNAIARQFETYLKKIYASECYDFWKDLDALMAEPAGENKVKHAEKLVKLYTV
ncbi:hypothetical protein SARC_09330 [Sphaeroforma arctica JP610]|uniref:RGS domain-containing protein n=1 Tax=Sphaeroforma arctica JP610 TaxID=667725 RepID=A0A0L0FQF0_9EUKA|nr:hypothetical protein SARC_09330 [Sphaeroforma arctica JP610]KNC78228.1 hypothetical protein SARC_09330 [Sphaeroforma arctica JP610]|eukprot:XP_014152130.1 hypothetical protein SARC_09330 [Sphaeroforma arctica JP610]